MRVVTTRLIVTGISVELPWIKAIAGVLTLLPIPALRDMFSPNDALYEHGRKFLHSIQASESSSNIFSNIAAEAEKGEKLSMDDVHLEASGLIIAGTDTTSTTLTYLTWAVLSRPTLQRDLEQEVSQLPGDYTDTDLEKLPLLNAVIEESLRLYGAAPSGLPRAVPPGGTSIAGHFINAGTTVTTQAYTYHRDASLFPDPDEYASFYPSPNDTDPNASADSFPPAGCTTASAPKRRRLSTPSAQARGLASAFISRIWNCGSRARSSSGSARVRGWRRVRRRRRWRWRIISWLCRGATSVRFYWGREESGMPFRHENLIANEAICTFSASHRADFQSHRRPARLQNRKSARITDTALPDPHHLPAPLIPHEPKLPLPPSPQPLQPRQHNPNRMPPTNRIPRLAQHLKPALMRPPLASAHALEIHALDALVDRRVRGGFGAGAERHGVAGRGLVVSVAEARAPMREIGADDESVGWVREVGG